jgi:hypothetical protein
MRNGRMFTAAGGLELTLTDALLDARRDEPYHQPNLPDGCAADGVRFHDARFR